MIKLLGMVLLVAGFVGLSIEKVKEEKASIDYLNELKRFITYLLREIEYSNIPIPDICMEYKGRSEGKMYIFIERVSERFAQNEGKSFDCIWKEEIDKLKKEEKQFLKCLSITLSCRKRKIQF